MGTREQDRGRGGLQHTINGSPSGKDGEKWREAIIEGIMAVIFPGNICADMCKYNGALENVDFGTRFCFDPWFIICYLKSSANSVSLVFPSANLPSTGRWWHLFLLLYLGSTWKISTRRQNWLWNEGGALDFFTSILEVSFSPIIFWHKSFLSVLISVSFVRGVCVCVCDVWMFCFHFPCHLTLRPHHVTV